jgi:hypothetical protein
MIYPTTGFTPELPEWKKRKNLLETLQQLVKEQPDNEYWKNKLEATQQDLERQEIAEQNEWLEIEEIETDWKQQVTELRGGGW